MNENISVCKQTVMVYEHSMKITLGQEGHIVVVRAPRNCAPEGLRALRAADKARYIKTLRDDNAYHATFQSENPIVKLAGRCSAGSSCIGLPPAGGEDEVNTPANMPPIRVAWKESATR